MTDLTTAVSLSGIVDIKYDDSRGLLYLSTASGTFYRWDVATESFDSSVSLPGPSAGFDITPDGQYALVGKGYALGDASSQIERINLSTLGVETLGFPSTSAGTDLGLFRIAIASNGTALATSFAPGQSGWNPLREFASEGNPSAASGVTGPTVVGNSQVFADARLTASEHGRYILIEEGDNSGNPLELYDSTANTIVAHTSNYSSSGFIGGGAADVNESAGLVVNAVLNQAYVFDLNLNLVRKITAGTGDVVGAHFSADGNQLFLWESISNQIDVYDTHTWQEVSTFSSVVSVSNNPAANVGEMAVSADGRWLFLVTGGDWTNGGSTTGFVAIDLTAREQAGGGSQVATTTVISSAYVVGAGQNLTFVAGSYTPIYALDGATNSTFTDQGTIQISSGVANSTVEALGNLTGGMYLNSLITIASGGSLSINATGAGSTAYGYGNQGPSAAFENDGVFQVSAVQTAVGVQLPTSFSAGILFNNTSQFTVSAANATAVQGGGATAENSGTITVTGTTSAIGFDATGSSITNSGAITVTASAGTAYGIKVDSSVPIFSVTNTGTITAQHAIYEDPSGWPILHLTNSGTINGDIVLGLGSTTYPAIPGQSAGAQIHNTGAINGAIHLDTDGNDLYDGRGGTQTGGIYLGAGTDTVYLGNEGETVYAGAGAAHVTGGTGADTFTGGAANDLVDGGGGNDVIDGGGGTNTASFASAATGVTVSLALQGSAQATGVGSVTLSNFQNLNGSAYADNLTGDANNNVIDGGGGSDVIDGGGGINTLSFASAAAGVTFSLALQGQAQTTGVGSVAASNFQNLTGSTYADHLTGDAGDNIIDGGGGGDDLLDGGGGTNTLSFASARTGVTASLALQGQAQATGVGSVTASNFQNLIGSAFNDTLQGDAGNNLLTGGAGADTFVFTPNGGADGIADFSDAHGDKVDLSLFYKFTTLSQVLALATQQNADTVIDFGGGASLTLQNVTLANLTAADFILTTGQINIGATTVTTDPALDLNATSGPLVVFTANSGGTFVNKGALTLTAGSSSTGVTTAAEPDSSAVFENDGTFSVTGVSPIGVNYATTHNTGTFTVTGTIAPYQTEGTSGDLVNSGSMTIQGPGSAVGVSDWNPSPGGVFQNLVGGTFTVSSSGSSSAGVYLVYGRDFENAGQMAVSARTSAVGLSYGAFVNGNTILNTGTITVSGATSIGISVGSSYGVSSVALTNGGTIAAQIAIQYLGSVGANIVNTGVLDGAVVLGNGTNALDSHLGVINGVVTLGSGSNTATLGTENNTVALAAGTHLVDGGGGSNTASYANAASGVNVSLALQGQAQNTGVGTDTLTNFQNLAGSAYADHLTGDANNNVIDGGGGNDVLDGRGGVNTVSFASAASAVHVSLALQGQAQNTGVGFDTLSNFQNLVGSAFDDTLHGGAGSNALNGGGGINTATYDGAYGEYALGAAAATVSGGPEGGTDTLTNIQRIQFVDGYLATSTADTAGEVYRLYGAALGRAPDPVGLAGWTHALNAGTSLQSVANSFVTSAEFQNVYGSLSDTAFVTLLYANVLHRLPDPGGLNGWLGALSQGVSRAEVLMGFSQSQEDINDLAAPVQQGLWIQDAAAAEVARLYDTTLSRLPDAGGLAGWTQALENGSATLLQEINGFMASAEFQATYGNLNNTDFVTLLYHNTLHRAPDQAGLNGWVGALNSGVSRAEIVEGFSESAEHIADTAAHVDYGIWLA